MDKTKTESQDLMWTCPARGTAKEWRDFYKFHGAKE